MPLMLFSGGKSFRPFRVMVFEILHFEVFYPGFGFFTFQRPWSLPDAFSGFESIETFEKYCQYLSELVS